MAEDLILDDGTSLAWLPKSKDNFFDRTTIIYGRRESGKSTIVKEIMYLLRQLVTICIVVSQSSATNSDFHTIVPKRCIKNNLTKEWLEEFLHIQKCRSAIYHTANNIEVLRSLFTRVCPAQFLEQERNIVACSKLYIDRINANRGLELAIKKKQIKEIETQLKTTKIALYKGVIRANRQRLEGEQLDENELCCLKFLDFQPHVMLVIDDCASVLKKWIRESTVLKEVFYNGRWYHITIIITAQDDKEIDSELRKNAMISFFTSHQAATANFTRSSNSYPKHEKTRAEQCIRKIFTVDPLIGPTHKKLVYCQGKGEDPFMYTIADTYDDFRIGCQAAWDFSQKLDQTQNSNTNEDLRSFIVKYRDI